MPLVTVVLGTRPEAIKLAPIILYFSKSKELNVRVVLTGQHNEMVYQILDIFNITPNQDLKLMTLKQSLSYITCESLIRLEDEFKSNKPDLVIVQGDTSSAFSAALSAFYAKIPVAHIEAGLRTKDKCNPYPEELNRRIISQIADLHFAPTKIAKNNLKKSGITKNVFITGNTVIDSLLLISNFVKVPKVKGLNFKNKKVILLTVHRRENWGDNLLNIATAVKTLAKDLKEISFLIPMHKNKIVRNTLLSELSSVSNVFLTEPLNYEELIGSIKNCFLVLTDSGGLQEEAPTFGKPVLILRDNTEREEALIAGTSKLIGSETINIVREVKEMIFNEKIYSVMSKSINPFGDGKSSQKIFKHCVNFLKAQEDEPIL